MTEVPPSNPAPQAAPAQPLTRLFGDGALRNLEIVGGSRPGVRDLYHFLLGASWWRVIAAAGIGYLVINCIFGALYMALGTIGNARAGSFLDSFFFSVQTFGTIGYGYMYPASPGTEALVTVESFLGLLSTAVVTGLVFAKFARPTARILWSKVCCISDRDGVPTLMFRVSNERRNHVVEANMKVGMLRFEVTGEGERIRRVHDIHLLRSTTPAFVLTWLVMHPITPSSPLYGLSRKELEATQVEIVLTLTGLDSTLSQTIHARQSYLASEIHFGARFADVLLVGPDGRRVIDYTKFHDTVPAKFTPEKMGLTG